MSLRNMNIDIGFKVNEGPLKRADKAADDFKDNVEGGTSSLDDLGSQAETAGGAIRDEFDESSDSIEGLGYQAEDAGDMITGAGEDAADSMQDLGSQSEDAGDMIAGASESATDSIQDLGYQSEDASDSIVDSSGDASDSLEDVGDAAGNASNVITVEFGNASDSVEDLGYQAGDTGDIISDASSYAADSLSGIGSAAGDAGNSVSEAGSEASDGLGGVQQTADDTGGKFRLLGIKAETWIKGAAVGAILALGGAFIVAASDATTSMMEIEDSMYVFQAETGNSIEVAEEFSDVLQDLHTNNTDSYGELADAATTVSQRFDVEGEALQDLTQDYLDYTKVTGQSESAIEGLSRIQKQYGIDTDGASGMLDKFLSVAQETGAPVETLQRNIEQMGPSLQAAGFSLDETLGLMGLFEESGVDSQRALRGLRTAMTSVENPEDLKGAVFDLMEMSDESERTTEALDLFGGTAGTQMSRALGEGRDAFDEMLGTVSESEGVVSAASSAFDMQFGERFTLLMREVFDPFREAVGPQMTEAMSSMLGWVESNMPMIQSITQPIFEGIGTAIGFVTDNFHILGPALGAMIATFMIPAIPIVWGMVTAAWGLAAGVLAATWPILAIGIAVGALVGIFIWAWENWDLVTEWFGIAVDWLGEKFSIGLQFIQDFFVNSFTFIRDFGINLWTGFSELVLGIWSGFTTGISNFVTMIGDGISGGFQSAVDFGLGLWTGFKDGVLGIWDGLVGGIKGFVNSIIGAINSMIGGINSVQIDIPGWVSKIPGVPDMESIGFNIPKIPMLADGGMVTDATLSVVGEGADDEAVLPLNRRIFNFLGRGIVDALGFGLFTRDEPSDEPGNIFIINEPDDDRGPEPIIIIDEPDDDDDPDDDNPYHEFNDYDEYNSASEYNDYSVEIKEIHINVSGTATREDGRKVGQGFKDYLDEHYGSLGRRVLTNQEG